MAILTDLPNELLLSIIAKVSPLYIDFFVRTCKRLYNLRTDTIRAHNLFRKTLPNTLFRPQTTDFLRRIFRDPDIASYPLAMEFIDTYPNEQDCPVDLREINAQALKSPFTAFSKGGKHKAKAAQLILPLLFTRLLNLRKMVFRCEKQRCLLETVSKIVEANRDPVLSLKEFLPLGRLSEAQVVSRRPYAMDIAILLAMIPTLRKLHVKFLSSGTPYSSGHLSYQHYPSEVTELSISQFFDMSFLEELVGRTHALRKFTYNQVVSDLPALPQPRRLVTLLKHSARQTLEYLRLTTWQYHGRWGPCSDYKDLSLGSLRGFTFLKSLVTCVDMFIKTNRYEPYRQTTSTIQRLVAWLPASLEVLQLYPGSEEWDEGVLRKLFKGLTKKKHERIPNLKLIIFAAVTDFEQVMPGGVKAACRETGIKVGYTANDCLCQIVNGEYDCLSPDCREVIQQLER